MVVVKMGVNHEDDGQDCCDGGGDGNGFCGGVGKEK